MLRIVKRQTIKALAEDLATTVKQPKDVFARIPIIVPSMAIGDWLNKYLASANGVSALTDSHFFGMLQWAWVEEITGEKALQPQAPLSMTGMHWQLFAWLYANGQSILQNAQHPLHELLSVIFEGHSAYEEGAVNRLWTLSEQFARIFVRYITLRPQWLDHWQQRKKLAVAEMLDKQSDLPDWLKHHYHQVHDSQHYLWQTLFAEVYQAREQRVANFWQLLAQESSKVTLLPQQIIIWSMQGMTPDMLDFIVRLAAFVDVTLYHFTPTHHMIDDIVDAKWLQRYQIDHIKGQDSYYDAHYDAGHDLVSRFGKQARDQARLLTQLDDLALEERLQMEIDDASSPRHKRTLLGILQHEIHELDNTSPSRDYFKYLIEQDKCQQDNSLKVHACHGLFRQLEVLRAEIVQWLNEDNTRALSDILIVLPEIGDEQALIRAVFPPDGRYDGLTLPARLTGVTEPSTMNLWLAVSGFFTLLERQFNAREVIDWLSLEETINALGVSGDEMQRAISLLQQAGFKRGFDEAQLQATLADGDNDYRFSFCYALDRLMVGLLMPDVSIYQNSVPLSHITMADANAINALCTVAEIIRTIGHQQARQHDVYEWLDMIESVLNEYFTFASHTQSFVVIAQSITDLRYQLYAQDALLNKTEKHPLPLAFVLNYIEKGLADRQVSSEPSGVITIGRLSALRNIPYKLIAFLNVNMDEFPSTGMDDRYDLTTIDQRQDGDQIKEEDDLSAFLDILLCAQENCWFFYDRLKPGDNEEHLPSILLQELLDYLSAHCIEPENAQEKFIVKHPQNPFDDGAHSSSIVPLWQAIQQRLAQTSLSPPSRIIGETVPSFDEVFRPINTELEHETISLDTILFELTHPARTFAQQYYGLEFLSEVENIDSYEPLNADGLTNYAMMDLFIANQLKEKPLDTTLIKRLPYMPAGAYGQIWFDEIQQEFEQRLASLLAHANVESLTQTQPQQVHAGNVIVSADLPLEAMHGVWVMMSAGKYKDKHILRAWLKHLLWSISRGQSAQEHFNSQEIIQTIKLEAGCTVVQCKDELISFNALPAEMAQEYLLDWLSVWQYMKRGLWLAPIELMEKVYKENLGKDSDKQRKNIAKFCHDWWSNDTHNRFYKIDHDDIWAHITQHFYQDEEELLNFTINFVATYTQRLMAPMYEHQISEERVENGP